jgi:beta-galactosidase
MKCRRSAVVVIMVLLSLISFTQVRAGQTDAVLPPGVKPVWDLEKANREQTSTRERVCLNGLWRWQPAGSVNDSEPVPNNRWGYFKVPGFWPGHTNYLQEDSQTLFEHPSWKGRGWRDTNAAWYQRDLDVPKEWAGRRIILRAEFLNSFAFVYVDGKKAAEMRFPMGEADMSKVCAAGSRYQISLLVLAMPLKAVMQSYSDTNSAKLVRGSVERRGLCGDVYLESTPAAARMADVKLETSVRKGAITVSAAFDELQAGAEYNLQVQILESDHSVHEFKSSAFRVGDLKAGRFAVTDKWQPSKLWDTHTPQNMLVAHVALVRADASVVDAGYPVRFGFREFWIDGRDFYLNGTRIHLSAEPLDNAQLGPRTATYEGARETMQRLRSFGINFVYTHNYGCEPGSCVSFAEILRAADDEGMLVAFSQPHFGQYDWKAANADKANGYAQHAAAFVQVAQNHPAVVAYSMSHNATGYEEDMNPDLMDGIRDMHADSWSRNNAKLALRAEAIVEQLDSSRIVYHHSSGNLGSMHTVNFYVNFAPIQEMSDWFEHWASHGVKPVFLCEYGVPFSWDWTQYRGWYKGKRTFGSAQVPWEFCLAEWDAQLLGDRAFQITEAEKRNLRWEADQFRAGKVWHRWDYPQSVGSSDFAQRQEVFAKYLADNWRAHRTWGLSANSPWEYGMFWAVRQGAGRQRKQFDVDWEHLQKPGFSPDYAQRQQGQMSTDYDRTDWIPTVAAQALYRNNMPLLGYIAGRPASFTSKDHLFQPGETVEKQLVIINNSREPITCDCHWTIGLPEAIDGVSKFAVAVGGQKRVTVQFVLPTTLAPGRYELKATMRFSTGETQNDTFAIQVLPKPATVVAGTKLAVFDPKGETTKLLTRLGVTFQAVDAGADMSPYESLIIGKGALTPDGQGPQVAQVRQGLKVVVFEQTAKALESRLGFRVAEYGLRQAFPRVPDHPLLAGLDANCLCDWRGSATLLPPQLAYTMVPMHGPTVEWCGLPESRVWRCGCRGNVASVLIEKPARGDFLSIVDGGYGLQYSPLLEYREGKGMVLFCQMDVTGRSEDEPAAEIMTRNILNYLSTWTPHSTNKALYVGDAAGRNHFQAAGFALQNYAKEALSKYRVLIVGPGAGDRLKADSAAIRAWSDAGGRCLMIGLDEPDANAVLGSKIEMKKQEHVAAYFTSSPMSSPFAGVGPADVLIRDPRQIPLIVGGGQVVGDGVLAQSADSKAVFCQLAPWQFDQKKQMNLKRSYRAVSRLVSRLAANLGVEGTTPLLARIQLPVQPTKAEKRWLDGFYLDVPEEWDDPYRFFRW